jgi:hypothetical protein
MAGQSAPAPRAPTSASLLPPVIPYGAICLRESPHFRLNSDPQSRTLPDRIRNLLATRRGN